MTIKSTILMSLLLATSSASFAKNITVSAAASLTNAFKEVGAAYEKANPQDKVDFNFAASGVLMQQMKNGAPVDVFASADQETMDDAKKFKLMDEKSIHNFVVNKLVLIEPIASNKKLKSLADLKSSHVEKIAVGKPETVPAGRYTKAAMEKANLWKTLEPKIIYTQNVRQAVDYVARGEVDAGLVYQTDAFQFKNKVKIDAQIPTVNPIVYPIGITKSSDNAKAASNFIAFVKGSTGQAILKKYGFESAK